MDQAQIPTLLGLAMNAVVVVFVMLGYFRRFATKDDIKDLNDRLVSVENRLGNVEAGQAALEAGLTALETRQAALETGLAALVTRQSALETRQAALETGQAALETRQAALETRFDRLDDKIIVIEKKADASLELHHTVRGDLKVLQASVNRLESYFETPKLKSS